MLKKVLFLIVAILGAGFLYQTIGSYLDDKNYPAPGKLIDIGGYKLHINEQGNGTPTVVMDAGTGSFSLMWGTVPSSIAQFTHVYTYDKAGLGWSDESPYPRTSGTMVQELHTLLEKVHAPKPYILVGHSLGGGTVQVYTDTYPDEVYGVVLVDAGHESVIKEMQNHHITFMRTMAGFTVVSTDPEQQNSNPILPLWQKAFIYLTHSSWGNALLTYSRLRRLYLHHFYTTPEKAPYPVTPAMLSRILKPSTFRTGSQEIMHYPESAQQIATMKNKLIDKPLIVIANGKGFFHNPLCHLCQTAPEQAFQEQVWMPLQKKLAKKSTQGKIIIAHESGHRIQDTEPELIVNAVRELTNRYRATNNIS